jgi:hypothetical protein
MEQTEAGTTAGKQSGRGRLRSDERERASERASRTKHKAMAVVAKAVPVVAGTSFPLLPACRAPSSHSMLRQSLAYKQLASRVLLLPPPAIYIM